MRTKQDSKQQQEFNGAGSALAVLTERLAGLNTLTVAQLRAEYEQVVGEPTRSRNKDHLRKRLAWKIQEQVAGGLSPLALVRIEELAPSAPARWRRSQQEIARGAAGSSPAPAPGHDRAAAGRDPRLPPAGTVLTRMHQGVAHQVTVLEDGFEYQGQHFISLSRIARVISGTPWNGFLFFGLEHRSTRKGGEGRG